MAPVDFSVNVHDGPKPLENQGEGDGIPLKNSFEVAFARRALMLVRRLLGSNGIEELLKDEIATSNEFWKKVVAQSKNEWRPARVKLSTRGIKHKEFLDWFLPKNGFILPENIASHPEHWTVYVDKARGGLGVCETLGDKVSWFVLKDDGTKSAFVENDPALPTKFTGRGYLDGENGVQIVETFHQFKYVPSNMKCGTEHTLALQCSNEP